MFPGRDNSDDYKVLYPKKNYDFPSVIKFVRKNAVKKFKLPKEITDSDAAKKIIETPTQ